MMPSWIRSIKLPRGTLNHCSWPPAAGCCWVCSGCLLDWWGGTGTRADCKSASCWTRRRSLEVLIWRPGAGRASAISWGTPSTAPGKWWRWPGAGGSRTSRESGWTWCTSQRGLAWSSPWSPCGSAAAWWTSCHSGRLLVAKSSE